MADETKVIRIVVDSSRAVDGSAAATRAWERMERSQTAAASSLARMEDVIRRVGGVLAGAFSARAILDSLDAFTRLTNTIKVTGAEGTTLVAIQERLFSAATKNGVEVGVLAQLYNRAALAGKELGASQEQLLEFTDGVTAALRVQGGSTESARGALLQLSQAIGAGTVRAEEFNSILEGALPIAQAAARGMDGMGGSVAKLRTAVLAGTVTSRAFFDALMKGFAETRAQAEGTSLTIAASLTGLQNSFTNFIGQMDRATGSSGALANSIANISQSLNDFSRDVGIVGTAAEDLAAFFRNTGKEIDLIVDALDRFDQWARSSSIKDFFQDTIGGAVDELAVAGARGAAMFLEAFRQLPDQFGKLFVDAMNGALAAVEGGINRIIAELANKAPWLGISGGNLSLGRLPGGGAGLGDYTANIQAAGDAAAEQMRSAQQAEIARREWQRTLDRQSGMEIDEARARAGGMVQTGSLGSGSSAGGAARKGGGGGSANAEADRIQKLRVSLTAAAEAQDRMTEAAMRGDVAFQEQEIHAKSLEQAMQAYGGKLDATNPKVVALADELEVLNRRIAEGKVAEKFAVSTTELERQNELLQAQINLMGEAPEIQAQELAIIKAKQEAEKGGAAITQDMLDKRQAAIEQNEQLKLQQEQIAKSQELWTEPLKQALRDIQSTAADAFFEILDTGKFSFQSLADTFTKIVKRMAAEFLALATIRPVMSVVVNAISPSIARQMGLGGDGSSSGGGGGIFDSIFGSSGGKGGFFGQTLYGGSPIAGAAGWADPLATTGGVTVGGALGAAAGAGMGIYNLATSKSTGQTIGGIASLVGAGVSLIPGIGQIAGPIISLLGGVLPGLFGGTAAPINSYGIAGLTYNGSGFTEAGGAYGPNGSQPGFGSLGASMQGVFDLFGGVQDASRVYGLSVESFNQQYGDGSSFANQTSYIVGPGGQRRQWGMGSTEKDVGLAAASAEAVLSSILEGAVGDISDNMRTALEQIDQAGGATLETIGAAVSAIQAFDEATSNLGKTVTDAEQALKQVDESFAALYDTAEQYGLATSSLDAAKEAARQQVGTDFATDTWLKALDLIDPQQAALYRLDQEKRSLVENNQYLIDNVKGYQDQLVNIEAYYGAKRAEIVEQFSAEATAATERALEATESRIASLDDLIKRLTPGGDLANLDPSGQLAGLSATYAATRAQAFAGDSAAIDRFGQEAGAYAEAAQRYYAGSSDYNAIRNQIIADAQTIQQSLGGSSPQASAAAGAASNAQFQQLMDTVATLVKELRDAKNDNARLNGLLSRLVANG